MKIRAVDPLVLGYRKSDPPMARNFAVVRIETDQGIVGWGEASTNWGHSYPTVFAAAVQDVCAASLLGTDPTDIRCRLAQLHVLLDGYLGWEGLTSQVIGALEIACWDILGQAAGMPVWQVLGGAARDRIRTYNTCGGPNYGRAAKGGTGYGTDRATAGKYEDLAVHFGFTAENVAARARALR